MNKRQSNIELLRLISMVLIVGHHFAVHGGFYFTSPRVTGNMLFLQGLSIGGKVGVDLFVLITGYFTVRGTFSWRKAGKVWGQIFFYSVVIFAVSCLTGLAEFSWSGLAGALAPILSNQWWFASAWMGMYLLSPGLNRLMGRLGRRGLLRLLGVLGVLWYIIPVLCWLPGRLRDLCWFVSLYLLAGWLRLHGREGNTRRYLVLSGLGFILTFLAGVLGLYVSAASGRMYETTYFDAHHLLILLTSVWLFRGFLGVDLGSRGWINAGAGYVFGMYLIHDSNYFRYPLWRGLLNCVGFAESPWLAPYAFCCIAGVFFLCLGLEWLRQRSAQKCAGFFRFFVKKQGVSFLDKGKYR